LRFVASPTIFMRLSFASLHSACNLHCNTLIQLLAYSMLGRQFLFVLIKHKFEVHANTLVMVSSPVDGDTNQGSNPGGIKKNSLAGHRKNSGRALAVAPVVGLGPPTKGDCSGL